MKIRLPKFLNNVYGNPLGLKDKEIRNVEMNEEIKILLNAGAIIPVMTQTKQVQNTLKQSYTTINKIKTTKHPIKINLRGVGVETLKDINKQFDSEEELKKGLRNDKVSLRNDIVEKLKRFYKVIK